MTGFDLGMAIGLMIAASAALFHIDKRMSNEELVAHLNKQYRKRQRALNKVAK